MTTPDIGWGEFAGLGIWFTTERGIKIQSATELSSMGETLMSRCLRYAAVNLITFVIPMVCLVILTGEIAQAETRYVKPSSEVAVRRGQGTEFRIISMVRDGAIVEFLEESEDYARVRLANGKEGWMLKRFLTADRPLQDVVATLETENQAIKEREDAANLRADELAESLAGSEEGLRQVIAERDMLKSDYARLQEDTADVVKIKSELERITGENMSLSQTLAEVQQENEGLKKNDAINWFLAGGGVLLLGMIIGRVSSRSRKRKPSLL